MGHTRRGIRLNLLQKHERDIYASSRCNSTTKSEETIFGYDLKTYKASQKTACIPYMYLYIWYIFTLYYIYGSQKNRYTTNAFT